MKITFIYINNKYSKKIKNNNTLIVDELKSFGSIISNNINQLYFLCDGKKISFNNKHKIKDFNRKNLLINVFNLDIKNIKRNEQLDYLICPECEEIALITFNKDKISIENCPNNHKLSNLSIDEFMNFQNLNYIECFKCNNIKCISEMRNHFTIIVA